MTETPKRHLPVFLDLDRRLVIVIGEGPAAEKRVRQLVRYRADVVVVTPRPSESLLEAEASGLITVEQRSYVRGDLSGAFVALCVTDDAEVQRAVFEEADSTGCLVNVAGEPRYCNFTLPAVINRDPLQIAISTGGKAPELARQLRKELDDQVGALWPAWINLLGEVRALVADRVSDPELQRRVLEIALSDATRERISVGMELSADQILDEALAQDPGPVAETEGTPAEGS